MSGSEHPSLATTLINLAVLHYSQSRYEETGPLLKKALEIAEKALGANHPNVKIIRGNLEKFYAAKKKKEKSEK